MKYKNVEDMLREQVAESGVNELIIYHFLLLLSAHKLAEYVWDDENEWKALSEHNGHKEHNILYHAAKVLGDEYVKEFEEYINKMK